MKKWMLAAAFAAAVAGATGQAHIIPQPVQHSLVGGAFELPKTVVVALPSGPGHEVLLTTLRQKLQPKGFMVSTAAGDAKAAIQFLSTMQGEKLGKEGYRLEVKPNGILISASTPAGHFYGLQSLLQMMPAAVESPQVQALRISVPAGTVVDSPRFGWRGLMLDVSRHFFTVAEVKRYIDAMVKYKLNLLHWHLTDDEGWRVEIKSLPNLTAKGAWRPEKQGYFGTFKAPRPDEPKTYGGFYTQAQIKEVVAYAAERFVQVLPEVDVPGHSLAAVVAYPELSCTEGADKYVVRSGEPIMDWSRGAPPIALVDNTLCPANEKVYAFMEKVVAELAPLFPFGYMHTGGDEAPHNFWEKNPQVRALMQREGLKTMEEVQAYFTQRLEKIVANHGKKMIGWDEILEGNKLPKSTAVMSWRGPKYGIEASAKGHEVVMSPVDYAYIDYMQGDAAIENRVYASLRLNKAYQFDPAPAGSNPAIIKGGQANLWTEQVFNYRYAEYMTWPRAMALAESVWSLPARKSWPGFVPRVEAHLARLDSAGIKFATSIYEPDIRVSWSRDSVLQLRLEAEIEGLQLHYSFDNTWPDQFSPLYQGKILTVPTDAVQFRVQSYRNGKPIGRLTTAQIADLRKRKR